MKRKQFTFYASYLDSIRKLKPKQQAEIILAICEYAINGSEPETLSDIAETVFTLVRPTLDSGRKKADSGELGGKQTVSKR